MLNKIFHYWDLPVKQNNKNIQQSIITLVDKILSIKKKKIADVSELELKLNQFVYELYNLNEYEIDLIEENIG